MNASESVEVSGTAVVSRNPSLIISSANILDEAIRKRFGLPDKPFGASGNVEINTPQLTVNDGGLVSVRNDGFGDGGRLQVNANSINLDNQGGITAATESGEGGNINLNLQDSLIMRRGSLIDTESLSIGNGGNINITAQGIFGLKFRDSLTEESDITASSQFGVNGTVKINNIGIDPSSGLVELPAELTDSSQQIAAGCSTNTGSSFVVTGRGGMPHNPSQLLNLNRTWSDIRDLSAYRQRNSNSKVTTISNKQIILEATGFIRNENGEIELVALENTSLKNKQVSQCTRKHT